jgi:hypothetical protein
MIILQFLYWKVHDELTFNFRQGLRGESKGPSQMLKKVDFTGCLVAE